MPPTMDSQEHMVNSQLPKPQQYGEKNTLVCASFGQPKLLLQRLQRTGQFLCVRCTPFQHIIANKFQFNHATVEIMQGSTSHIDTKITEKCCDEQQCQLDYFDIKPKPRNIKKSADLHICQQLRHLFRRAVKRGATCRRGMGGPNIRILLLELLGVRLKFL